ncbi:MAG: histidine phosphatase family protein [Alphaproteobacteria bacterium]|nr:histidine phosphatase family protein [Alphaproteobacteria bacterium]
MPTQNLHYWLVRHAPINAFDDNGMPTNNRFIGQLDIDCDLVDAEAIKWLVSALPKQALLLTSHLRRSHQTADKLIDAGLQITARSENQAFAEQNFGDWQGMDYDSHYQYHQNYWHDVINNIPPNGESFGQLCQRVTQAMMYYYNQTHQPSEKQNIIIIAHAGSIRAAIADCHQQTPASVLQSNITPLSLTHLHFYQENNSMVKQAVTINATYQTNEGGETS